MESGDVGESEDCIAANVEVGMLCQTKTVLLRREGIGFVEGDTEDDVQKFFRDVASERLFRFAARERHNLLKDSSGRWIRHGRF